MKKDIIQKMEFKFRDTEEHKIEFTHWISTCPKFVRATYLR